MERDVEKEKTRKKKSQHQQEHLHIWKEKKVKRMEILGTQVWVAYHDAPISLQSSASD